MVLSLGSVAWLLSSPLIWLLVSVRALVLDMIFDIGYLLDKFMFTGDCKLHDSIKLFLAAWLNSLVCDRDCCVLDLVDLTLNILKDLVEHWANLASISCLNWTSSSSTCLLMFFGIKIWFILANMERSLVFSCVEALKNPHLVIKSSSKEEGS